MTSSVPHKRFRTRLSKPEPISSGGFVLPASRINLKYAVFSLGFVAFWPLLTVVLVLLQVPPSVILFSIVFDLLIFILAAGGMESEMLEMWSHIRMRSPRLWISDYPLRPGKTYTCHFRRSLRTGAFNQPHRVHAKLVCEETVTHFKGYSASVGNDGFVNSTEPVYKLETRPLSRQSFQSVLVDTGQSNADFTCDLSIPANAAPAYEKTQREHNHYELHWVLTIDIAVPDSFLTHRSTFYLQVLPRSLAGCTPEYLKYFQNTMGLLEGCDLSDDMSCEIPHQ